MHSVTTIMKKLSLSTAVLILGCCTFLGSAGLAFADDPAPCVPPADSSYGNGVHHPVGTDASTFTYNCDTDTWTNQYYTFYPATATEVANYPLDYSYDCGSGTWTMTEWDYSPATGTFFSSRVVASNPGLATNCPPPAGDPSGASDGQGSGGAAISDTGTGSTNSTSNGITLNGTTNNSVGMSMSNTVNGNATTGNTFVLGNTTGGSATSGDALSLANIANLLQSTSNAFSGATTFTANINGDVNGDFMFDPSAIMNTGSGSNNSASNDVQVNTNDTNNVNAAINNDIDLGATSGNATVAKNTTGGDATSGNAAAVVNLMNLINSTVSSGQSFIGTININGDLNGDILLPQGVLDQLLASTGTNSNNVASANFTDNSTTTNNVNQAITNNINSSATTGSALVGNNTVGGSATTGKASTGVTLLNLTGSNTIGKNDLLVFVNVLGKWVGMIMNAPAGTTAASLGGGIISNTGGNSNNTTSNNLTANSTTTNNSNLGITNNVNVHAKSGDASVTDNTIGGNATSGNAKTAVNILNLEGSNLNLSDWFGILFINVFGIWNGSFGINTSAGDPVTNPSNNPVQAANQTAMLNSFKQFASFTAHTGSGSSNGTNSKVTTASAVLGSSSSVAKKVASDAPASNSNLPTADNGNSSFFLPIVGVCLAGIILLVSERDRIFRVFSRKH